MRLAHDVAGLTVYPQDSSAPLWWGMAGLIVVESTVFASFISTYFYLHAVSLPAGSHSSPDLPLPTINALVLILSGIVLMRAETALREHGNARKLFWGQVLAMALALLFLGIKAYEYLVVVEHRWFSDAYGSIVWMISGFHSLHVFSVVLKTAVMAALTYRGYFTPERYVGVQINGIYWRFVVVVWIPLYIVLYWSPRWMD